jgi:hypothetical protein
MSTQAAAAMVAVCRPTSRNRRGCMAEVAVARSFFNRFQVP